MNNKQLAFVLSRLALGVNFLMHGLVRFPKLNAFRSGMMSDFEKTWLPDGAVAAFATVLPFIECILGVLLLLGLYTRLTLTAGMVLMIGLIFGSSLLENWSIVGTQMVYVLFFAFLLVFLEHNAWALDKRR